MTCGRSNGASYHDGAMFKFATVQYLLLREESRTATTILKFVGLVDGPLARLGKSQQVQEMGTAASLKSTGVQDFKTNVEVVDLGYNVCTTVRLFHILGG